MFWCGSVTVFWIAGFQKQHVVLYFFCSFFDGNSKHVIHNLEGRSGEGKTKNATVAEQVAGSFCYAGRKEKSSCTIASNFAILAFKHLAGDFIVFLRRVGFLFTVLSRSCSTQSAFSIVCSVVFLKRTGMDLHVPPRYLVSKLLLWQFVLFNRWFCNLLFDDDGDDDPRRSPSQNSAWLGDRAWEKFPTSLRCITL